MRRIFLPLLLVFAAAAAVLQVWPIRLPPNDPRVRPALPHRETGHPVVLLVDSALFEADAAPADLKWIDLLRQVFGGCDVRTVDALARDPGRALEPRRLAVIGRSTLGARSVDFLALLRPFVSSGLTVVLEGPEGDLAAALGVETSGLETRTRLPWPQGPLARALGDAYRLPPARGLNLPYGVVSARPAPTAGARTRPTLSPAGRPLVWTLVEGEGAWILHMLDLAELARTLHQGRVGGASSFTVDLAASDRLRTADRAWADAWVEALLDSDSALAPWPRLWPAPAAFDGWLLLSQNQPVAEDPAPGPITGFAASGPADGLLARWPGDAPADSLERERIRLGPLRWAWRPAGLTAQSQAVQPAPSLHRNRSWRWPGRTDEAWATLVGADFRADASFGPAAGEGGWTTGTVLPFRPLSSRGLPHVIWEVSTHWRGDPSELDLAEVARWLRENKDGSHGAVHVALEGRAPDSLVVALTELALRHRHAFARVEDLLDHWDRRADAVWRWDFRARTLRVEIGPAGEGQPSLATAVPFSWSGLRLAGWDASWARPRAHRATTFGREMLVVEHPPGGGAVTFTYGGR